MKASFVLPVLNGKHNTSHNPRNRKKKHFYLVYVPSISQWNVNTFLTYKPIYICHILCIHFFYALRLRRYSTTIFKCKFSRSAVSGCFSQNRNAPYVRTMFPHIQIPHFEYAQKNRVTERTLPTAAFVQKKCLVGRLYLFSFLPILCLFLSDTWDSHLGFYRQIIWIKNCF